MACQTCPVALTKQLGMLTGWVLNILEFEKEPEIRRGMALLLFERVLFAHYVFVPAATVLILSLFRGLASNTLYEFPVENLRRAYRALRYIEDTDADELTRYQARVALSDLDMIMRDEIFKK